MNLSEESTITEDSRRPRNKTETKFKSQSPQIKPQFTQTQLQHKKSKTKERVQQKQEQLPNVTRKLNPKSTSFSKKRNQFKPAPQDFCLKYYVGWGNNEALVKRVMSKRTQWKETTDSSSMFVNFKWQQSERGYRYERLIVSQNYKQLVNHFEHHREISNKSYLIKNLSQYCEKHKLNVFDYTPLTFVIDFSDENCDYNITQFLKTYEQFAPKKPLAKQMLDVKRRLRGNFSNSYQRDSSSQFQKIQMNNTFLSEDSTYMWLLKPTFLNRGRGISIFDNLETLVKLVSDFQEGLKEKTLNQKDESSGEEEPPKQVQSAQGTKKDPNQYIRQQPSGPCIIKSQSFVIQKYIERPALINKRKFDIRVWGLVTQELDAYFFQEGYIRTSSEDFTYNIENTFVHLTNNAIQKYSKNYGEFEDGNQLSFKNYQEYLKSQNIICNVEDLINKMKERIWMVFNSVRNKINFEDRKYCFEIFGFDFILDADQEVWLIEVNTNPCIEESSPLLKMYIPRMLDDAFKLTLDILFPPQQQPHKQSLPSIYQLPQIKEEIHSDYPVIGYPNDENMWMLLGALNDRKISMFNPTGPKDKPLCMEFQKDICIKPQCTLEHKYWPCPDYDKGFCYLGSSCDKKHIVRKLCMDYVYGFCKDGPECKMQHVKLFDLNDRTQELKFTEKFYSKLKQEQATFKQSEINVKPVICKSCQEVGHKSNVCKKTLRLSPTRKILCGICETEHTIYEQGKKQDCQYKIPLSQQQQLLQQQSSQQ